MSDYMVRKEQNRYGTLLLYEYLEEVEFEDAVIIALNKERRGWNSAEATNVSRNLATLQIVKKRFHLSHRTFINIFDLGRMPDPEAADMNLHLTLLQLATSPVREEAPCRQ